ncbi:MAG: shikimate dehydrogenase [Candidatus Nanopelagicales bacterium]
MSPAVTRRAAVLGSPIGHSLSPVLHRAAYADLGLDWTYAALECDEVGLADFLAGCGPEWAGLSLTMPLKRAVLPLLAEVSAVAALVGAANTVVFGANGPVGHNTDVGGIVAALRGIGAQPGPAVVLGAGATAASAIAALAQLGCRQVTVQARRPEVAADLAQVAEQVGVAVHAVGWREQVPGQREASIVVCTVPAGAAASLVGAVPADPGALLDVSYAPWPPPLLAAWVAAGGVAVGGDEMLLHQAVEQVRLMTGRSPDVEVMRAALRAELARRR